MPARHQRQRTRDHLFHIPDTDINLTFEDILEVVDPSDGNRINGRMTLRDIIRKFG